MLNVAEFGRFLSALARPSLSPAQPDANDPAPPINIESAAALPPAPEALPLLHNALNTLLRR
jgi:hypothetical protein